MIAKKKNQILKAVRYLCLLCVIVFGLISIVGSSETGRACNSGSCENKWMSDGYVLCCPSDFPYGRRENKKCYKTFADAYTGTSTIATVPGFRECY